MSAKATTMRNDLIDANFAAYATYFDGLLTEDKKLKKIHEAAVFILGTIKSQKRR